MGQTEVLRGELRKFWLGIGRQLIVNAFSPSELPVAFAIRAAVAHTEPESRPPLREKETFPPGNRSPTACPEQFPVVFQILAGLLDPQRFFDGNV